MSLKAGKNAKIADFELIQEIVRSIRNLRAEKAVPPAKRIAALIAAGAKTDLVERTSQSHRGPCGIERSENLTIATSLKDKPKDATALVVGSVEIYLPLAGMVDLADEKARLEKESKEAQSHIERLEKLLSGDFANKAPAPVVQKERENWKAIGKRLRN